MNIFGIIILIIIVADNVNATELRVRVGATVADKGGKIYKVEKVIPHESYDDVALTDTRDIGLILLAKPIKISEKAKPVKLSVESPSPGQKAWVTGYGSQQVQKRILKAAGRQLMAVEIPIVNTHKCRKSMQYRGLEVAEDMICAGALGRKDACRGDSGGPLVINNTLYGLTAWGIGCGQLNTPGVYTDLSHYSDWIVKNYLRLLGPSK